MLRQLGIGMSIRLVGLVVRTAFFGMVSLVGGPAAHAELRVASDFPGGSAEVLSIDAAEAEIEIRPTLHFDRGWPCWWYFRVDGAQEGKLIRITVRANQADYRAGQKLAPHWSLPKRAALSTDDRTWVQTDAAVLEADHVTYQLTAPAETFWLAWGPPYQLAHAEALLAEAASKIDTAQRYELATSRDGRPVHAIRLGNPEAKVAVWLQARQHAWESGSSWVAEGFLRWVVSDDPVAIHLRQTTEIHFVPIMDIDNVERGAGGKDSVPRDHNRDWDDAPAYPEVAGAQREIKKLVADGRLRVFLDLHNPSPKDNRPFYFGPSDYERLPESARHDYDRFLAVSLRRIAEPSGFCAAYRFSNYIKTEEERSRVSRYWVANQGGPGVVSLTLETSWNTLDGTVPGYQQVGRGLGGAVAEFLARP